MAVADELDLVEDEAEDWRVSVMFEWGRKVGHTWGGGTALAVVFGLIVWWSEHLPRIAVHCDAQRVDTDAPACAINDRGTTTRGPSVEAPARSTQHEARPQDGDSRYTWRSHQTPPSSNRTGR
jgi:hypothetical protein